ncbi:DUF308 domain-containing protein [Coralloluteibacterium stylophorae]|uniref:DUF308 domain-containing protein n=1 Tax=Coralloluteibacterium stylophorae TaxID=1776034 RepID=A0A8J7VVV3_9GAMM|nr:DUF308 domain-containing protein [Coralloluteibacterium stylophorae]MBS7456031.1 DUF308 domain-containing protein [Coralloluteibacterium stylophorae]
MQTPSLSGASRWLTRYYSARAAFSLAWVAAAFALGRGHAAVAAVLLCLYPAWDAVANYVDAVRSGGLRRNPTQALNAVVSLVAAAMALLAVQRGPGPVLGLFGAWAIVAGLLQLATAVRRWKTQSAQWASVLSGAQSALAGGFFIKQAFAPVAPPIVTIAGYAAIGALYFLVSAIWLALKARRGGAGEPVGA